MRSILLVVVSSANLCAKEGLAPSITVNSVSELPPIELLGILKSAAHSVIFAKAANGRITRMENVGETIAGYRLKAVDFDKGSATFDSPSVQITVWLPNGSVRIGDPKGSGYLVAIPPLDKLPLVIGLDEEVAPQGKAHAEMRVRRTLNVVLNDPKRNWEDRNRILQNLLSGAGRDLVLMPKSGIDEAFANKYHLSPADVESLMYGYEVSQEYQRQHPRKGLPPTIEDKN